MEPHQVRAMERLRRVADHEAERYRGLMARIRGRVPLSVAGLRAPPMARPPVGGGEARSVMSCLAGLQPSSRKTGREAELREQVVTLSGQVRDLSGELTRMRAALGDAEAQTRVVVNDVSHVLAGYSQTEIVPAAVARLETATREIFLVGFTLDHPDIVEALLAARRRSLALGERGTNIRVMVDAGMAYNGTTVQMLHQLERMQKARIEVRVVRPRLHIKALIVDNVAFVGSFNWTRAATQNFEWTVEIADGEPRRDDDVQAVALLRRTVRSIWETAAQPFDAAAPAPATRRVLSRSRSEHF
jgi:phosphatidylserine/phosphatidylglycerophosphate/cardiolipin synthase-like enzyme